MPILPCPPAIASHPEHLNAEWAQQIINQHITDTIVSHVKLESVDIGTTTRIRIKVYHDGPVSIPRQWFVKIPSLNWRAKAITALPRLLQTEIRFYKELAKLTNISKPSALFAKSYFARGSTLVLNNVSEQGAIPGQPGDQLSLEQALRVVEILTDLHGPFWNKTKYNREYQWLAGPTRKLEDHLGTALAVPLMKRGLKKADSIVNKALHEPALQFARQRRTAMQFLSAGSQTLIHHDCHPGNLYWKDKQPGLLDWQMVRSGEGVSDIAYFLATSLSTEDRRAHESELLQHYIHQLDSKGIKQLDYQQMQKRYRAHLIYPFEAMLITLAIGGMMDLDANLKLIQRAAAAIEDNHAFDYLPI